MIKVGKDEEIATILELTRACGRHLRDQGIDQWDELYPDIDSLRLDVETNTLFVYYESNKLIAMVVLNEKQDDEYSAIPWNTSEQQRNLVVHRLAVHPSAQERGIARKLMDFAEDYARKMNYDAIRLDTFSLNPRNQIFYQNRGYTELGKVYLKYKKEHPYICYELLLS